MSRRLLLIGGAAGAGKTTCARHLAASLNAGWLQLDTLWITAQEGLGSDSEAYRFLRVDEALRAGDASDLALVRHHVGVSQLVCRWLPRVLTFELQTRRTLVVDGAWLLPTFAAELSLHGVEIRAAFIHEAELAEVQAALESRRGVGMVAPWHARSARALWAYGNYLAGEADHLGIPVVTARPRESLVTRLRDAIATPVQE